MKQLGPGRIPGQLVVVAENQALHVIAGAEAEKRSRQSIAEIQREHARRKIRPAGGEQARNSRTTQDRP